MGRIRLRTLNLDEALCTYGLITAARVVDVRRVVLRGRSRDTAQRQAGASKQRDKGRTRKQIGHSMAPRYIAASGCRIVSFEFVLACPRLCERLEDMLPVSRREDEASEGESGSCGGSFLCARICSSSHDSS